VNKSLSKYNAAKDDILKAHASFLALYLLGKLKPLHLFFYYKSVIGLDGKREFKIWCIFMVTSLKPSYLILGVIVGIFVS